jgi:predicted nuclease of predicted toxin-antitoxin system
LRILLDENMPESLCRALSQLGHEVDSVASLRLKGLDNGRLYRDVAQRYDLCFTKDRGFVQAVRAIGEPGTATVLRVIIPQAPHGQFTAAFGQAFRDTCGCEQHILDALTRTVHRETGVRLKTCACRDAA